MVISLAILTSSHAAVSTVDVGSANTLGRITTSSKSSVTDFLAYRDDDGLIREAEAWFVMTALDFLPAARESGTHTLVVLVMVELTHVVLLPPLAALQELTTRLTSF